MNSLGVVEWKKIFAAWETAMKKNADYLIQLDGVAGDSDLGLTMSDGFAAARKVADGYDGNDIGMLIYCSGKAIMRNAPSSLGTLLGSGFLSAGKNLKGKEKMMIHESYIFFEAIEKDIMINGQSKVGDKTFLDGLDPAVKVLKEKEWWLSSVQGALEKAAAKARAGSDNTRKMIAKHGRMAVRGEQSLGMLDPGSVVAAILVETFANVVVQLCEV